MSVIKSAWECGFRDFSFERFEEEPRYQGLP